MQILLRAGIVLLLLVAVAYVAVFRPLRDAHRAEAPVHGVLAVEHATIYVSPDVPPIADGTVVMQDGRIAAVGAGVKVPAGAVVVPQGVCGDGGVLECPRSLYGVKVGGLGVEAGGGAAGTADRHADEPEFYDGR
jgi:hypothetical protein